MGEKVKIVKTAMSKLISYGFVFGIYNFSLGYQKAIGSQWFLEIEPFIKVPLGGVGFGEVKLWSTGSFFSLKYNFR